MRQDNIDIIEALSQSSRAPRYVVGIIYPTASPYFTSHSGLSNVPGVPVQGVLANLGGTTQQINPDEGRSTIGSISFDVVDIDSGMTDELRDQLDSNDRGPRRREVRVFRGFTDDFDDFVRLTTQQVEDVQLTDNVYKISCADIQRQMRDEVFQQKKTRLTADLTDVATTITVDDTDDFELVAHTAAFTDSPDLTVGYFRIKKTKEVISYTGKTATTFTGCVRGRFGTRAQALDVDTSKPLDKLPEVEEFVYLEMPGPELAYAILTGVIRSSTTSPQDTLPDHWHVGIAESLVNGTRFDAIGLDLVDTSDDTAGLVFRFTHLDGTDGKQFIEEQLMLPMGTFMPIDVDGIIGLQRFARILTDAPQVVQLDETNIVSASGIHHDQKSVVNQIQFDWNYDGEDYTRRTFVQDNASISRNDTSTVKKLQLRGITITRHTTRTLDRILRTFSDRYGEPPERMSVTVLPSLDGLEVGDIVRVTLARLRDYQDTGTLDRSFEIQQTQIDWRSGNVTLTLAGTGREVPAEAPAGSAVPLLDPWYTSEGTELSTVLTIVADHVTANGTLTGDVDLNAAGAIFYYDGDLTIDAGVDVGAVHNVQLRIKGTLTINGDITGDGNGITGTVSPDTVGVPRAGIFGAYGGTEGYIGTTCPGDGVTDNATYHFNSSGAFWCAAGIHEAAPVIDLEVTGTLDSPPVTLLHGLPTDLRGTAGSAGLPVAPQAGNVIAKGGDGGDSGAGLLIVCRGLAFGASGGISISGTAGSNGGSGSSLGKTLFGGSGGGGAPGALYVLLDGDAVPFPALGGKFVASRGSTPVPATLATLTGLGVTLGWSSLPGMGMVQGLPADLHADSAHQIQYIPTEADASDADDEVVPPPTGLTLSTDFEGIGVTLVPPPEDKYDSIEIFASVDNDRSNAVVVDSGRGAKFLVQLEGIFTRWVWAICRKGPLSSVFHPLSSTAGVKGSGGTPVIPSIPLGTVFNETFDAYGSVDDFLSQWEIVDGDPTITIEENGSLGGKVLRVTGLCTLAYLRNIPYDTPQTLYRIIARVRPTVKDAGDEKMTIGFLGVKADGTTILDKNGNTIKTLPCLTLINALDMGDIATNTWVRLFGWMAGESTTSTTLNANAGVWNDYQQTPATPLAIRTTAKYVRPVLQLNQSGAGSTAQCEIDYIRIDERQDNDPATDSLVDPNFTAADDEQFVILDSIFSDRGEVSLDVGGGEDGSNAIFWEGIGVGGAAFDSAFLYARHPIHLLGDTITFRFTYKGIDNQSPGSISPNSDFKIFLDGMKVGTDNPRRYKRVGGTLNSVSLTALSTLTLDNTWRQATATMVNIYTNSNTAPADFAFLTFSPAMVGYLDSPAVSENIDFRISRIRIVWS